MNFLLPFCLALAFTTTACSAKPTPPAPKGKDISLQEMGDFITKIAEHTKKIYVEPTTHQELLDGALSGMLAQLDPHSGYLNAKQYDEMKKGLRGEYGGLGMEVVFYEGVVKIVSAIEDTPADKAGLQSGDLILRIDDKPVFGMTLFDAVDLMRGKPNTKVELTIRGKRKGKEKIFPVSLKRAIIKVKSVKHRVERNVGYIRITTFDDNTDKLIRAAVKEIKKETGNKLKGYVLDVRNNGGGLLDEAASVTDLFINKGVIVSMRGRNPKDNVVMTSTEGDITQGLPIAVLVNSGSASASEILAGALQDHKRGIVVGTGSFGKGSVQLVIPLSNGGAMKLTTALYYTPSGRAIQQTGIKPDIEIEQIADLSALRENTVFKEANLHTSIKPRKMKESISNSSTNGSSKDNGKEEEAPAEKESTPEEDEIKIEDYQLVRAVDIVLGMSLYRSSLKKPS